MADVRPLPALRYDLDRVSSLGAVIAPPYDVIDDAEREQLMRRSAHNVVAIDLPRDPAGGDIYRHAAKTIQAWTEAGVLIHDRPALWALTQDFVAPDGSRHQRNAILARVRVEEYGAGRVRPHERTQPGPKQDRLDLTRATGLNLSPIFSLTSEDAWPLVAGATTAAPWAEATGDDGTVNRIWRLDDPDLHQAVATALSRAELLIADGHHRYETARAYAAELGGEGDHRYTLMALTGLADPGLTVFPTHRLLRDLSDEDLRRLDDGLARQFEPVGADAGRADPQGLEGVGVLGYINPAGEGRLLRLRDRSVLDRLLAERSRAYRDLDAVVLETLVLKDLLGMSEDDIAAKRGLGYAKSRAELDRMLAEGGYQAAFLLRATPVEQVREVAAAGESMPPKSTYFFPKIPTGIVFNPVGNPT